MTYSCAQSIDAPRGDLLRDVILVLALAAIFAPLAIIALGA